MGVPVCYEGQGIHWINPDEVDRLDFEIDKQAVKAMKNLL